jgi:hypothetical protein
VNGKTHPIILILNDFARFEKLQHSARAMLVHALKSQSHSQSPTYLGSQIFRCFAAHCFAVDVKSCFRGNAHQ